MSTQPYIFILPLNLGELTFRAADLPITLDEDTRNFFLSFIDKANESIAQIREFYIAEKKSNMSIWCCLLGCTIVGIIPCCCWMNSNGNKKKKMIADLDSKLQNVSSESNKSLKDFNGYSVSRKKNNDAFNWEFDFEIKCDSIEHGNVPFQGLQGIPDGITTNMIHLNMLPGGITNQEMSGGGYSSGNLHIPPSNIPLDNTQLINNQTQPKKVDSSNENQLIK